MCSVSVVPGLSMKLRSFSGSLPTAKFCMQTTSVSTFCVRTGFLGIQRCVDQLLVAHSVHAVVYVTPWRAEMHQHLQ